MTGAPDTPSRLPPPPALDQETRERLEPRDRRLEMVRNLKFVRDMLAIKGVELDMARRIHGWIEAERKDLNKPRHDPPSYWEEKFARSRAESDLLDDWDYHSSMQRHAVADGEAGQLSLKKGAGLGVGVPLGRGAGRQSQVADALKGVGTVGDDVKEDPKRSQVNAAERPHAAVGEIASDALKFRNDLELSFKVSGPAVHELFDLLCKRMNLQGLLSDSAPKSGDLSFEGHFKFSKGLWDHKESLSRDGGENLRPDDGDAP